MNQETCVSEPRPCFDEDAADVLRQLRGAIVGVVEALPGKVATAADLQRTLRIDKMLCWKLFRVITAAGPLAAGAHLPGTANLRRFLDASEKLGRVPSKLTNAARGRAEAFERLVRLHAGDRATFDSMVSHVAGSDTAEKLSLMHRRAAFRANRHFWGIQVRTQLKTLFVQPGSDPGTLDMASIEGFLSLRRVRADAPLAVSWTRVANDDGTLIRLEREPLDLNADSTLGIALLEEFCTKPIPRFRVFEADRGFILGELLADGVGETAAITCIVGYLARHVVGRYRDQANQYGGCWAPVRTACEVLVLDLVLRQGTFDSAAPCAGVYAQHLNETAYPAVLRDLDRIPPLPAPAVYLGKGTSVMRTPDVPNYAAMAQRAFDRLGADGDEFDVYRCRIEYPVMPSTVLLRFDLPERPE